MCIGGGGGGENLTGEEANNCLNCCYLVMVCFSGCSVIMPYIIFPVPS